jgi:hypothetical protein
MTAAERIKTRNLADLAARYKQQRTELNQGAVDQKNELQQMVQNDAIARGMANSTVPGDRAVAGYGKIDQATTNALANLLNSYNSDKNAILNQYDQMSLRGGGGSAKPAPAADPKPPYTPVTSSPYLDTAVKTGVVPLQAALAYTTGSPNAYTNPYAKPKTQPQQKAQNPYEWWRYNH